MRSTGGFGDPADGSSLNCLGTLEPGADGNCGTAGAPCGSHDEYCSTCPYHNTSVDVKLRAGTHFLVVPAAFCGSNGYCHPQVQVGDACLEDKARPCGPSLYAWRNHATGACTCQATPPPTASQRARARRTTVSLCPATFSACPVGNGFECVDTQVRFSLASGLSSSMWLLLMTRSRSLQSNLERCGGCSHETGGVDCTALPGIEAVGCVNGECEIWACATGFDFDAQRDVCVAI